MDEAKKSFEERLSNDYDLKRRVRMVILLSALLYVSFLILDAIYVPKSLFGLFLAIRLAVLAIHGVLLLLVSRMKTSRGCANLAIALTVFDVAGIAIMIQFLGGFTSGYVQGLYLIIQGMVVVVPLAFRETAVLYAFIWASYAVPGFFHMGSDWRNVFSNLFFLTSIVLIGIFGSYIMDNIRRRELRSRVKLEETTAKLQESNVKLLALDELKTQFFANVNHELRTPLTLMLAPLGPMIDASMGRLTAKQKDTLLGVRQNGLKLLKLINNLLDLTKLEEGKMRLKIKSVEFVDYVNSLLASVKPLADRKSIRLYFQHPSVELPLFIDSDQFEKIVLNLLSNSVKFTPEGGRITVFLDESPEAVQFTVEDTGIGIPPNMLETIFDRFSQVDGSLSRAHEGTGIGLSLVRELVALHGGRIRVESEMGKGSRFIVDILKGDAHYGEEVLDRRMADQPVAFKKRASDDGQPRVQDIVTDFRKLQLMDLERENLAPAEAQSIRRHDYNLVVIDDNPEVLKLMKLLLEDEFDLHLATSGEEGLRLIRDKMPDVVISDVMMPEMDGHTLTRRIKSDESLCHIPVILVTARSGADMLNEGIEAGADDYLPKPFDSVELKARIRSQLRMRRAEADLALANRNLKMRTSDLVERQRSLFLAMVRSLVSALEAKDKYTRDHSRRVTEISLRIGRLMKLDEREMNDLEMAAVLHDVGKIAIPERILHKKSALTDEEYAIIRQHPVIGENILKPAVELQQIARIVRFHHERYDGRGYPDGLKGQAIPIGARIMAVADSYDAITSSRPYRDSESHNYALKEVIKCSGLQFDPEVVEHFIEALKTLPAAYNKSGAETPPLFETETN
ncbi:MAG: ATP-binding protein [Acidobacteriota bacterium]|nr:ATP-binding protein [Acidobacteriota bacterium]